MIVRPFQPTDAPAWVALTNRVLNRHTTLDAWQADETRRPPDRLHCRWVTEQEGSVVGTAALYEWAFAPPGYLHAQVLVHPAARRQGRGAALAARLLTTARETGAAGLQADVSDADPDSLRWAQARGFVHAAHRFTSELDLRTFDLGPFQPRLDRVTEQGVTITDLAGADEAALDRYLNFVADRLPDTPDLAGHPRWPLAQVRETLHLDRDPRPEWLVQALAPDGTLLGISALVHYRDMAYNEFTAVHPQARGRGLALPMKLHAIRRAQEAGLRTMRTNNHSRNAPMIAVNDRLGFVRQPGRFELHLPLR